MKGNPHLKIPKDKIIEVLPPGNDIRVRIVELGKTGGILKIQYSKKIAGPIYGYWLDLVECWSYHHMTAQLVVFNHIDNARSVCNQILEDRTVIDKVSSYGLKYKMFVKQIPKIATVKQNSKFKLSLLKIDKESIIFTAWFLSVAILLRLGPHPNDDGEFQNYFFKDLFKAFPLLRVLHVLYCASYLILVFYILPEGPEKGKSKSINQ